MMRYLLVVSLICAGLVTNAQTTVQIGTGTSTPTFTLFAPIYMYSPTSSFPSARSNILYEAAELASANVPTGAAITSIAFYKVGSGATNGNNLQFSVYMANTSATAPLPVTSWSSIQLSHTQVYSNTTGFQVPAASGWVTITLATPFIYTGGSLEIAFQSQFTGSSPYSTGKFDWQYTPGFANYAVGDQGSTFPTSMGMDNAYGERPNIQITFSGGSACLPPTSVVSSSVGCDSITLNWNSSSGGSVIEYGISPLTAGSGTSTAVVTPPYTIKGLSPNTSYDIRVADTCTNDTSSYITITETTLNAPLPAASFVVNSAIVSNGNAFEVYVDASASTGATSYSWNYGNGTGNGVLDTGSYSQSENGAQTIRLVVSNGCGTDTLEKTVNVNIGLAQNPLDLSLSIYPNPAQKEVNVSFSNLGSEVILRLTDVQGKEILQFNDRHTGEEYNRSIDVSQLPRGVYLLEIQARNMTANRKISLSN